MVAGTLALAVALKGVVDVIQFPCQFCLTRVKALRELPPEEQAAILTP